MYHFFQQKLFSVDIGDSFEEKKNVTISISQIAFIKFYSANSSLTNETL